MKTKQRKEVALPVGVAKSVLRLLKQASADAPPTSRLRRELSKAAAEIEVRIGLQSDGRTKLSKKAVLVVLRGIAFLANFKHELKEVALALMGNKGNQ